MPFKRSLQRYGTTPEPETPYQKAGQVWDQRIGSARVQARNWRLMAFGCFALACSLSAGLIWQSLQSRIVPYIVEIDRFGEARAIAPVAPDYQPADAQLAWYLARFIKLVRSVSTDPVLVRQNWLAAYDFVTGQAVQFLNDYANRKDPFAGIGERSVSVEVSSVVRASDQSFQIKWQERIYERGALMRTERWTAILTVISKPPANVEELRKNPLGLYVRAIDWSREFDTSSSGSQE